MCVCGGGLTGHKRGKKLLILDLKETESVQATKTKHNCNREQEYLNATSILLMIMCVCRIEC